MSAGFFSARPTVSMGRWSMRMLVLLAALALPAGASAWVPGTQGPVLFSSAEGVPSDPPGLHI